MNESYERVDVTGVHKLLNLINTKLVYLMSIKCCIIVYIELQWAQMEKAIAKWRKLLCYPIRRT